MKQILLKYIKLAERFSSIRGPYYSYIFNFTQIWNEKFEFDTLEVGHHFVSLLVNSRAVKLKSYAHPSRYLAENTTNQYYQPTETRNQDEQPILETTVWPHSTFSNTLSRTRT